MAESAGKTAVRAPILVSGRVQGVGYRAFAACAAPRHGLVGRVELDVEGTRAAIEALVHELKTGPPAAHVRKIETEWKESTGRFSQFSIWY
jgi:acylphosphatase